MDLDQKRSTRPLCVAEARQNVARWHASPGTRGNFVRSDWTTLLFHAQGESRAQQLPCRSDPLALSSLLPETWNMNRVGDERVEWLTILTDSSFQGTAAL